MNATRPRQGTISRRTFLSSLAAWGVALSVVPGLESSATATSRRQEPPKRKPHLVVVGAGAFGGWTALHLLRRGARVTLLDAWGAGNSRASSGGETRITRATYGPDQIYVEMVLRSQQLWRENEARWQRTFFRPIGVLWMTGTDDRYEKAALPLLRAAGHAFEVLTAAEAAQRNPQVNFEGVRWAILEKDAGYLTARLACQAVLDGFVSEGGEYRPLAATAGAIEGGELRGLQLSDASRLVADHNVFACGPWLPKLFPDVLGQLIQPTRQEVFFFGAPAGDTRFSEDSLPAWIDNGERIFYGIPGNQGRGFKLADDTRGVAFDPTSGERVPSVEGLRAARDYLGFRFPALKDAPLLEARVCQYENSPDHHFILDRHPRAANLWLIGGGSGHGFKHGPAVGELVAEMVLAQKSPQPFFALSRFARSSAL